MSTLNRRPNALVSCTDPEFGQCHLGEYAHLMCPAHARGLCRPRRRGQIVAMGLGKRYADPSPERLMPQLRQAVKEYLESLTENIDTGRGLWLAGPLGVGKTSALACIADAALAAGKTVVYRTANELCDLLARSSGSERPPVYQVDMLLIDDIGAEASADWVQSKVADLVDWRYRQMLATCYASNVLPTDLQSPAWERVADRIRETCDVYWQDGESWRRKGNPA